MRRYSKCSADGAVKAKGEADGDAEEVAAGGGKKGGWFGGGDRKAEREKRKVRWCKMKRVQTRVETAES